MSRMSAMLLDKLENPMLQKLIIKNSNNLKSKP